MRVVETEAFLIDAVKDVELPVTSADTSAFGVAVREILERPPAVVTMHDSPDQPEFTFSGQTFPSDEVGKHRYEISQASSAHVRSFVIKHPLLPKVITDEYGNRFTSFTTKGNNFSNPTMLASATAANDIMAFGLQESPGIRRILRASEVMRAAGIGTEYVIGMSEPKTMPTPDTRKKQTK